MEEIRSPRAPDTFQFLIGTLRTEAEPGLQVRKESEFQFLIGTLRTEENSNLQEKILEFQFLIGTLRTSRKLFVDNIIVITFSGW